MITHWTGQQRKKWSETSCINKIFSLLLCLLNKHQLHKRNKEVGGMERRIKILQLADTARIAQVSNEDILSMKQHPGRWSICDERAIESGVQY